MAESKYDEQIAELEVRIDQLGSQLAESRDGYIKATAERLAWFFANEARETAAAQGEQTKRLGKRLAKLKTAVSTLQGQADALARDAIGRKEFWPDQLGAQDWSSHMYGGTISEPGEMTAGIRRAASKLGPLLVEYGYELRRLHSVGEDAAGYGKYWQSGTASGADLVGLFPASKEMHSALHDCKKYVTELQSARKQLAETRNAKATAEAGALWDEA